MICVAFFRPLIVFINNQNLHNQHFIFLHNARAKQSKNKTHKEAKWLSRWSLFINKLINKQKMCCYICWKYQLDISLLPRKIFYVDSEKLEIGLKLVMNITRIGILESMHTHKKTFFYKSFYCNTQPSIWQRQAFVRCW